VEIAATITVSGARQAVKAAIKKVDAAKVAVAEAKADVNYEFQGSQNRSAVWLRVTEAELEAAKQELATATQQLTTASGGNLTNEDKALLESGKQ